MQVAIHTDTLNEAGFVEDTIAAIKGRTIHTYHTEGAGGGHAPDIIRLCGEANVLPSSTNPTMPFTRNTLDEHLDMLMVCHHLSPKVPEDVAFADSRIRPETIAAEDVLHDLGAISMMSSDSQAMGRIGEVICRTWQTADKMKRQRGPLPGDSRGDDNLRVRRYVAKYTINPAIAHGISTEVGSIEVGKLADLVLWKPAFFGVKPELIIKGGFIAGRDDGRRQCLDSDAAAGDRAVDVRRLRRGARYAAACTSSARPASTAARSTACRARESAVRGCRGIGKRDLVLNDALPKIEVNADTYEVRADGELLTCEPADVLPLAQRYFPVLSRARCCSRTVFTVAAGRRVSIRASRRLPASAASTYCARHDHARLGRAAEGAAPPPRSDGGVRIRHGAAARARCCASGDCFVLETPALVVVVVERP